MNELALFAGAGGGILGGHLLGWQTVCAVEWEPYPASVLCARQNDGLLPPFPIWDDVQTFDGKPWRGIVDVVSGGFPCQDISAAGKGTGIDGERSGMWREMARIIHEVQPRFAFVENSPMLTSRGLGTVLGDLAAMGFDARWGVLGAADIGANHQRNRIWIVANAIGKQHKSQPSTQQRQATAQLLGNASSIRRSEGRDDYRQDDGSKPATDGQHARQMADTDSAGLGTGGWEGLHSKRETGLIAAPSNPTMAQPECEGLEGQRSQPREQEVTEFRNASALADSSISRSQRSNKRGCNEQDSSKRFQSEFTRTYGSNLWWWATEPNVGRVANGVAARVDRLKAIGNGQVPLCAATAWRLLA